MGRQKDGEKKRRKKKEGRWKMETKKKRMKEEGKQSRNSSLT